jgi:AcrR family transcriptional regulator
MTTADGPRWRRLEPDARREQILERAIQLFGDRPYADVSTTEIAREAGVARGLLNHYFGTKRELYLEVVRRMVLLPGVDSVIPPSGTLRQRVERSVDWFLETVGEHGKTFVAVTGAGGIGDDPEIEKILAHADDLAARKVLETVGVKLGRGDVRQRAMVRAYGGLVKAAIKEWVRNGSLTRDEVHLLLSQSLIAIVRDVLPKVAGPSSGPRAARSRKPG